MVKLPKIKIPGKRWVRITIRILLVLIFTPLFLFAILRTSVVQTWLTSKITHYLSKELKADIRVGGVNISPFLDIILEDLYVGDQHKDTLLYAKKFTADIGRIKTGEHLLKINGIKIQDANIHLYYPKGDSVLNLQYLIDYFSSKDTTTSNSPGWKVSVKSIELSDCHFRYSDMNESYEPTGIDFNHLDIKGLQVIANNIDVNDSLSAEIKRISFWEQSGFSIFKLSTHMVLDSNKLKLNNLKIRTGLSNLNLDLDFTLNEGGFDDFVDKVKMKASIRPSDLNMKDIAYFSSDLDGMRNKMMLSGEFLGTVSNFKLKNFDLDYGRKTHFKGDIRLNGLPDIEATFVQVSIKELQSNYTDISSISLPKGDTLSIPPILKKLGNVDIKGNFTGFYNDFVAYAKFRTALGNISSDLSLKNNPSTHKIEYQGNIKAAGFNLGEMTDSKEYLGMLNLSADIKGSGLSLSDLHLTIEGLIDSMDFKGNNFNKITIDGEIKEKNFSGNITVRDEALDFDFNGSVDYNQAIPVFDFSSSIRHAKLNRLHMISSDTIMEISSEIACNFSGISLDSIQGWVKTENTQFKMNENQYQMKNLLLTISSETGKRRIGLTSDFIDANIFGNFLFKNLYPSSMALASRYLPSLGLKTSSSYKPDPSELLNFEITLKNTSKLSKILVPGLFVENNAQITGMFRPYDLSFAFNCNSKRIDFNNLSLSGFKIKGTTESTGFNLKISANGFMFSDSLGLDSLQVFTQLNTDTAKFGIQWENQNPKVKNSGHINGLVSFTSYPTIGINLLKSSAVINDSLWEIKSDNQIIIDTSYLQIANLEFSGGIEKIKLNGVVSSNPLDKMMLELKEFDIANFDPVLKSSDFEFDGIINGNVEVRDLYNEPNIITNLEVRDFTLNNDKLGNAQIISNWDPGTKALFAKVEVMMKGNFRENIPVLAQGYYYPDKKDSSLDFHVDINNFKIKTISNLLSSFTSKFTGYATGQLNLKGNLSKPLLLGKLKVMRGEMLVDYLNVLYSFSHEIIFGKNYIGLDNLIAMDPDGNKATINGKISHEYFSNWKVDISIDPQKLLALNTTYADNNMFYGKAWATGFVKIHGPVDELVLDIAAQPNKGTQLFIPINTTMDVSGNNYITFIKEQKDSVVTSAEDYKVDMSGITVNFNMTATQDATVKIFLPYEMGNIKATGEGDIKLGVDTRGNFSLYGNYEIKQGAFQFTLQKVIKRDFDIQPGSKVIFRGNPYDTRLDLKAIHKIEVPLTNLKLQSEQSEVYNKKVTVDCGINLTGSLFNPEMSFKMNLKEKDPEINRIVFNQIDTNNQEQMAEQMIFLLVLRQFKPIEKGGSLALGNSVGNSSWEMISNQLNGWLSQISTNFDIGVNYKPGDNLSSDEITVALSTQLFNDRVTVDGNFGVGGNKTTSTTNQNASNIVGDVNVDYKVTRDGRFRLKAFNKSNNVSMFETNAPYTQGVGFFYRKEFDYFSELFKRKSKNQTDTRLDK